MKEWRRGQQVILEALKQNASFDKKKHGNVFDRIQLQAGDIEAAEWFKFQSFTTAVIEDEKLRVRIKEQLAQAIQNGETKQQFFDSLKKDFKKFKAGSVTKLNTVFETQQALAFGAAQQAKMIEVANDFPFWKYSSLHDAVTRPDHLALDGKIFAVTDQRFYPPIAINCRCTAIPLTASQAARMAPELYVNPETAPAGASVQNEFAVNKQQGFVKWLKTKADTAEPETKQLITKAIERLVENVQLIQQGTEVKPKKNKKVAV